MDVSEFQKGSVICAEGEPISQLLFITSGSAEAVFDGRAYRYEHGDMLGVCDLSLGIYSCTYTAKADTKIVTYPYKNLSALETLFREKSGVAYLMVCSMCRQILGLIQ
jgi:CRP-like cAMP-binding protein